MNQYPTLLKLQPLLRMEVAVLLAVLVVAFVGFNQFQRAQEAQDNEADVVRRVTAIQDDLRFWDTTYDPAILKDELAQLQEANSTQALPTLEAALRLRDDIASYAGDRDVTLSVFGREDRSTLIAEEEYLIIHYSMLAQGSSGSLVGVLELLLDLPTISVQILEFVGPLEGLATWEMTLEFDVIYQSETGGEA